MVTCNQPDMSGEPFPATVIARMREPKSENKAFVKGDSLVPDHEIDSLRALALRDKASLMGSAYTNLVLSTSASIASSA